MNRAEIEAIRDDWPIQRVLDELGIQHNRKSSRCPICDPTQSAKRSDAFSFTHAAYYCWGDCNEGGDVFKLLMKVQNISFREAVERVRKRTGRPVRSNPRSLDRLEIPGAYRLRKRIRETFADIGVSANDYIVTVRDARLAQAVAVARVTGEDTLWDEVYWEDWADKMFELLDGVMTEGLYLLKGN